MNATIGKYRFYFAWCKLPKYWGGQVSGLTNPKTGETKGWQMGINTEQSPHMAFRSLLHESLHLAFPEESEEVVDGASRDIARFLWRLGYRPPRKRIGPYCEAVKWQPKGSWPEGMGA